MVRARALAAITLISSALASSLALARSAPAVRYGDRGASAAPRDRLAERIEQLVAELARAAGRPVPLAERRLSEAAEDIARRIEDRDAGGRPPSELVQGALWLHGLVEPAPHIITATMTPGDDDALLTDLKIQLPTALAQGRFRRVGVGTVKLGGLVRVLVALQESFVDLEPLPRALPAGGQAALRGRLAAPFVRPEVFVTAPDGKRVDRLAVRGDAARFESIFRCGSDKGAHQIELTGEDRFGATVLANFPVFCGVGAPQTLPAQQRREPSGPVDGAVAETMILALLNADRARAGLPPLTSDPALQSIARGHSGDMREHGFFGHVSPSTGSAADRTRRAHYDALLILENVARAYSPAEAERGLMDSPGHRANLLNREVTRVGVGVVASDGPGGSHELLVTQLFAKPPEVFDGARDLDRLRRRIVDLRKRRGLRALAQDPALDGIAASAARDLASGALREDRAGDPVTHALGALSGRYRALRSVLAVATSIEQLGEGSSSLLDQSVDHLGLGIAPGRKDGQPVVFMVVVLGQSR